MASSAVDFSKVAQNFLYKILYFKQNAKVNFFLMQITIMKRDTFSSNTTKILTVIRFQWQKLEQILRETDGSASKHNLLQKLLSESKPQHQECHPSSFVLPYKRYAEPLFTDLSALTLLGEKTDKQGGKKRGQLTQLGFLTIPYFCVFEDQHSEHGTGAHKVPEKQKRIRNTSHVTLKYSI